MTRPNDQLTHDAIMAEGYISTVRHRSSLIHGRRSRGAEGTSPPQNLEWGDANTNCPPPQILSYRYKNERPVALKMRQNSFSARWGELTTLPHTP